ncbi:hypothetical protein OG206_31095 [Streptomyces sp. NBC_01341]|uniref:hypothetical protein n=1 Tax=Streptomyces sp. NBC_01341 TaxID=2903831 RepID=UPI002E13CD33|nr:hypothetical protein OG206_31095 [Streptomyces sp. NBC_01341]
MDTRTDLQPRSSKVPPEARVRTCRPATVEPGREPEGPVDTGPERNIVRSDD